MMENPNSRQVAGQHYRAVYQHWDLVFDLSGSLTYFQGCATKYAARWRKKHADNLDKQIEDLQKVAHYLEKMIWILNDRGTSIENEFLNGDAVQEIFTTFVQENELSQEEITLVKLILFWETLKDLEAARTLVEAIAERARKPGRAAAMLVPPPPPAPAPVRFTLGGSLAGRAVAGRYARHSAPTAPHRGEIGVVVREIGAGVEIRYGSLPTTGQVDHITVDKHYVEILPEDGMEHPFGYDARQEG